MIYIVSGLPRSGTSMMMKMLEAGGLPVLVDADNPSTEQNPGGAYAYEGTKKMPFDWMSEAEGKAIKVTAGYIDSLPPQYQYKIVFMERNLAEIETSQRINLKRTYADTSDKSIEIMEWMRKSIKNWLSHQNNMDVLLVDYNKLVFDPLDSCKSITNFLGLDLNVTNMSKIPNNKLYRNRMS
jgi:hypothetical protein